MSVIGAFYNETFKNGIQNVLSRAVLLTTEWEKFYFAASQRYTKGIPLTPLNIISFAFSVAQEEDISFTVILHNLTFYASCKRARLLHIEHFPQYPNMLIKGEENLFFPNFVVYVTLLHAKIIIWQPFGVRWIVSEMQEGPECAQLRCNPWGYVPQFTNEACACFLGNRKFAFLSSHKHVSSNFLRKQLFKFRANRSVWDFHFIGREKEQNARDKTTISMSHILLNKVTTNKYEGAEMFNIRIDYVVKQKGGEGSENSKNCLKVKCKLCPSPLTDFTTGSTLKFATRNWLYVVKISALVIKNIFGNELVIISLQNNSQIIAEKLFKT
uniref:Uncharacterized protein n=1 Tax=Glossina austeni TaxID=7395 RepID=A0A1A9VLR5_GLOAU